MLKAQILILSFSFCVLLVMSQASVQKQSIKLIQNQTANQLYIKQGLSNISKALKQRATISNLPTVIINFLSNNNISCKQKSQYMNQTLEMISKKVNDNEKQIKAIQDSIQQSNNKNNNQMIQLNDQQKIMLESVKKNLQLKNFQAQIKLKQVEQSIILDNLIKLTANSDKYFNTIQNLKDKNSKIDTSKQQIALKKLQAEVQKIDKMINETISQRSNLHKKLTNIKLQLLQKQVKSKSLTSPSKLEAQFRLYSEKASILTQQSKQKQQQLAKLNSQLKQKQATPTIVDDDIASIEKQIAQKEGPKTQQSIKVINQANTILSSNIKVVDDKIKMISSNCFV